MSAGLHFDDNRKTFTAQFSVAGPRGPQGEQGIQGPKGDPGKSAYQYALDGGYTGTEAEFANEQATLTRLVTETKDVLYVKTEVNLSENPSYNVIIGESTGKWGSGSNRVTYFVPVGDAVQIDVTANSNAVSVIALLKTDAHASGTKPDYATGGYRMNVGVGKTVSISIPDDCNYIAVMGAVNGVDYSPERIVLHRTANLEQMHQDIESNKAAIEDSAEQTAKTAEDVTALCNVVFPKIEINVTDYPSYDTIITSSAGTWGQKDDRATYFVPVGDAAQIDVTANSNAVSVIALLKTLSCKHGTLPDYATGGYRMTIEAGNTQNITVPDDCNYIAIMGAASGVDYIPSSVVFHTLFKASTTESTPPIGLHTMPESEGVLNCIKRCRQLTDIKWTPLLDIPRWSWQTGGRLANGHCDDLEDVFKAGVEYTGIPYARANKGSADYGYTNFWVGLNVDFGAFVTAVRERNSVMKESVFSLTSKWACMYGVVCSTLASYAYNISYKATSTLPSVSGMTKIGDLVADGARMDASLIKLGDMIIEASNHVGVITDIVTDASGNVTAIEVSEATTAGNGNLSRQGTQFGGLCRRKGWSVDEFFSWWKNYSIYRYAYINSIPYTPSPYVNVGDELPMMPQIDYACLPYMGEGFKYKAGSIHNSNIVVGVEGFEYLRVKKDGEYFGDPIAINGETYVDAGFTEKGSYCAYLCNMDGDTETKTTGSCHWSVV